jgi:hypothetical protein
VQTGAPCSISSILEIFDQIQSNFIEFQTLELPLFLNSNFIPNFKKFQ